MIRINIIGCPFISLLLTTMANILMGFGLLLCIAIWPTTTLVSILTFAAGLLLGRYASEK